MWPRLGCRRYASESQLRRLKQTCVGGPLKNKARCQSPCSPTSKSSLIMWRIKQVMKMKSQRGRRRREKRKTVQPVQQRRINIHCVQKFVSTGHKGGGQRAAAAPRIDPFLFLRDSYSRQSATTATCLPIGKWELVLWEASTSRNATDENSYTVATVTVCPSVLTFCSPRMADWTQRAQTQHRWINTISWVPCLESACVSSIWSVRAAKRQCIAWHRHLIQSTLETLVRLCKHNKTHHLLLNFWILKMFNKMYCLLLMQHAQNQNSISLTN